MLMDGDAIAVGDGVYDMLYGAGVVMEVLPQDRFRVKFQSKPYGLVFASNGVGVRYSHRTLFWHDPIIVVPTKNAGLWGLIRPVVTSFVSAARTQFGGV
jgi:hypothetical protein